ncbi:hypothetical protein L596_007957 [Steinernema carpocapsae]|uniref:SAP domain-containing protein n=1 Tax=Steinernema carpocapsae TaxID=34508 RepID=A0A4U5PAZ7_STECR|nr:hypothetical protein L596_007957 [Steinernema carpocapsae]
MSDDDPVLDSGKHLADLKVVELKKECDKHGLSKAGNKQALYDRLKEFLNRAEEVSSSGTAVEETKGEIVNPFIAAYKSEQEKALKRARKDAEQVRLNTSESDIESANTSIVEPEVKRQKQDSETESFPTTSTVAVEAEAEPEEPEAKTEPGVAEEPAEEASPEPAKEPEPEPEPEKEAAPEPEVEPDSEALPAEVTDVSQQGDAQENEVSKAEPEKTETAKEVVEESKEVEKDVEVEVKQEVEAPVEEEPMETEAPVKVEEATLENQTPGTSVKEEEAVEEEPKEEEGTPMDSDEADAKEAAMVEQTIPDSKVEDEEMTEAEEAVSGNVSQEESAAERTSPEPQKRDSEEDRKEEVEETKVESADEGEPEKRSDSVEASSEETGNSARHSEEEPEPSTVARKTPEKAEFAHHEEELDFDDDIPNGAQEHEAAEAEEKTDPEAEPKLGAGTEPEESQNEGLEEAPDRIEGNKMMTVDDNWRIRPVSPARYPKDCVIHIKGLTRPLQNAHWIGLLRKFGDFDLQTGFWMDKIKSNCFIKYETPAQAALARYRLHNVSYPGGNKNGLKVDFSTVEILQANLNQDVLQDGPKRSSLASSRLNLTITIDNKEAKRHREEEPSRKSSDHKFIVQEELLVRRLDRFKSDSRDDDATLPRDVGMNPNLLVRNLRPLLISKSCSGKPKQSLIFTTCH